MVTVSKVKLEDNGGIVSEAYLDLLVETVPSVSSLPQNVRRLAFFKGFIAFVVTENSDKADLLFKSGWGKSNMELDTQPSNGGSGRHGREDVVVLWA